jgi:SAM-dependent methyltransferase
MNKVFPMKLIAIPLFAAAAALGAPAIFVNQVAYDARGAKIAVVQTDAPLPAGASFGLLDSATSAVEKTDALGPASQIEEWAAGKYFYRADFSAFRKAGVYKLRTLVDGSPLTSPAFHIEENALAKSTLPSIVRFYRGQRATSAQEWAADSAVRLNDGSKRVNMRGGWCDASGDVSKYFSHLAYANFMSPQQTPMVTWELTDAAERIPGLLTAEEKDSLQAEALWGADYLYRALSPDDYFYMVVFSYFSSNANDRKVVGLLANSVTNNRWQCAFRSGGGMAIAALARISQWKKNGVYFTSQNYLDGAKRAFAHLLVNNKKYDDDGKENVIDDYCALMAATELWIAAGDGAYRDEARKRMNNLAGRMTPGGWFRADDGNRPFWHGVDAGLPVVALVRYLDKESDPALRATALSTIKRALDYELAVTNKVANPFGYARQNFLVKGAPKEGFFIPQDNETGWWWQGENARLGSLAAAAILGGRLVYPANNGWGVKDSLAAFASQQMAWILGCNPFSMCFMNGFGANNPPKISANFGHGTGRGGISNGITGKTGNADGTGIDYRTKANGDEWRWIEQWIPHAGWFLTAAAAMAQEPASTAVKPERMEAAMGARPAIEWAGNSLRLRLPKALEADMRVSLYSPEGRKVGEWIMPKAADSVTFKLPNLGRGVYSVELEGRGTYRINPQ